MKIPSLVPLPSIPANEWFEIPFSLEGFELLCSGERTGVEPPRQVDYIARYLHALGCSRLLVEGHYVDRDFRNDYSNFFSLGIAQIARRCARIHCFAELPSEYDGALLETIQRLESEFVVGVDDVEAESAWKRVSSVLNPNYLGFVVVRPLAAAPIGRTVLRQPRPKAAASLRQRFHTARPHTAHIGGLPLTVEGVEFAQQDHASSACATVALWTALHALHEPRAVPTTPSDITGFATESNLTLGRALPARALSVSQMSEAMRALGFASYVTGNSDHSESLRAQLTMAVTSPLPCIAIVDPLSSPEDDRHAVVVLGGESDSGIDPESECDRSLRSIYLHDDMLGPYADAEVVQSLEDWEDAQQWLKDEFEWRNQLNRSLVRPDFSRVQWPACLLRMEDRGRSKYRDVYWVRQLMFPLPPDMFLSPGDLYRLALTHSYPVVKAAVHKQPEVVAKVRPRVRQAMQYVRDLIRDPRLSDGQRRRIRERLVLSRLVGVVHVEIQSKLAPELRSRLCDVVYDMSSTEIHPLPLATIAFGLRPEEEFDSLERETFDVRADEIAAGIHAKALGRQYRILRRQDKSEGTS